MPINASHEYFTAEKESLAATTTEDKIEKLEALIRVAPKHKSSENLLKELRTRLKKLLQKSEKSSKKSGKKGIKKEGFQFALIGLPNSGKSSLLSKLTNAKPKISPNPFSTTEPLVGTFTYQGIHAQVIDLPPLSSDFSELSILNSADCILIVIENIEDLLKINPYLKKATKKRIIILNKLDLLSSEQLRKLVATMKSKKIDGVITSTLSDQGLDVLKQLMFQKMDIIRIYTKEPHKPKTEEPITLSQGATVKDAAEKILKGFSQKIKHTVLTGPSGKFPNQNVGLTHKLKDKDILEFHTK